MRCLRNPVDTNEAMTWPETQSFLRRLGMPMDLRTTDLIIRMRVDQFVEVDVEFQAVDMETSDPNTEGKS